MLDQARRMVGIRVAGPSRPPRKAKRRRRPPAAPVLQRPAPATPNQTAPASPDEDRPTILTLMQRGKPADVTCGEHLGPFTWTEGRWYDGDNEAVTDKEEVAALERCASTKGYSLTAKVAAV